MQTFVQSAGTVQFSDFAVNRMEEIEHPGRAAAAKKKEAEAKAAADAQLAANEKKRKEFEAAKA